MNKPHVSILIPCYNVEKYLPHCLDSIVNQSYNNLQIVLINDGSKDNTWQIMQEYARKDNRIEIYNQENQGVANTRNNLLDKVKGDYVLFIDSDDWCELDMVDFLVNKALTKQSDIVTCSMVKNDETVNKNEYNEEIWEQPKAILEFLRHFQFNGSLWNKLVKTSILHNSSFRKDIGYGEDALFCWEFLQSAKSIVMTNRQLYHYRMNNASISHQPFNIQKYSAYNVWTHISNDTLKRWPQFSQIALGHFAVSMTILLRDAAHSSYKRNNEIKNMQEIVKKYSLFIRKYNLASWRIWVYSLIAGHYYSILKYLP